ncbi:hypothetical protein ACLOJK_036249 [Asimina triloba]
MALHAKDWQAPTKAAKRLKIKLNNSKIKSRPCNYECKIKAGQITLLILSPVHHLISRGAHVSDIGLLVVFLRPSNGLHVTQRQNH